MVITWKVLPIGWSVSKYYQAKFDFDHSWYLKGKENTRKNVIVLKLT